MAAQARHIIVGCSCREAPARPPRRYLHVPQAAVRGSPSRSRGLLGQLYASSCSSNRSTDTIRPTGSWAWESWRVRLASILAAGLLTLLSGPAWSGQLLQGPPRVVDGDTLEVAGEKVRLYGLDAPEKAQMCANASGTQYLCGQTSAEALRARIGTNAIECQVRTKDMYGRNVSSCSLPGVGDIGDWLVKNGYAVAYRQYSKDYVQDEDAAREAHRGIWEGTFQIPSEWRRENKGNARNSNPPTSAPSGPSLALLPTPDEPGLASPSSECQIKGNISSNGKIYHVPGGRYYEGVKIEPFKGERWFCSVKDAEAAGWRASGS